MISDLKYAVRQLIKSPGFTFVAVLSLALGIGANTAIFSLVNEALLKSLPVKAPQQLVVLKWTKPDWQGVIHVLRGDDSFSMLTFDRLREHDEVLSDLFAFGQLWELNVNVDGQAEIVDRGQLVSGNYFAGLGVQPFLGRMIGPSDDRTGSPPVVVISYRYWQRRFDGEPAAIGKTIRVNNVPVTVVGVAPPGFLGVSDVTSPCDISLPLAMWRGLMPHWMSEREERGSDWWLSLMGRLRPGVTLAQAEANLEGPFEQSVREAYANMTARPTKLEFPKFDVKSGARPAYASAHYEKSLLVLIGLAGLVLIVACGNVANLLLARSAARQREIAVRLALGAGRGRVVRQLFTESALLALMGGSAGLLFAYWGKGLLLALHPLRGDAIPFNLDPRVLAFTAFVAAGTSLLFGVAPALRATRFGLNAAFQGGTRSVIGSRPALRLGKCLMVVQMALSVVLLTGAGLFMRTLYNLQSVDTGFDRHHLLLFRIDSTLIGYKRERFAQLCERISDRLSHVPGVRSVAFSGVPVLSGNLRGVGFSIPGYTPAGHHQSVPWNTVSQNFFDVLGMPILLGRGFNPRDVSQGLKVVVINQAMAKKYFGDENPVGRRVEPMGQIVGVVRDAKYLDLKDPLRPTVYQCFSQAPEGQANFAVRTANDSADFIASIQQAVRAIEPALPVADIRTQDEEVEGQYSQESLIARLSGFFGLLALALVCVGLYGLMSYSVLRRTNEIGIRMALGALPGRVLRMILHESFLLVAIGVLIGIAAACAAARLVASMLFGLSATDPLTYAAVALLLIAVALFACWFPARRAAHVDPVVALRAE